MKPGDVIAYYARARDIPRAKQSTLARSEIFFLEVKPFNEEYTLAQSQSRWAAGQPAQQLEGLISSQKEIISATWNLERRSSGRTLGRRHQERRRRAGGAERTRRTGGRRRAAAAPHRPGAASQQFGRPQRRGRSPPAGDPVRDAVDAMARALEQLQTQKTAGAIPHEMAALNALLQAQAEIRQAPGPAAAERQRRRRRQPPVHRICRTSSIAS